VRSILFNNDLIDRKNISRLSSIKIETKIQEDTTINVEGGSIKKKEKRAHLFYDVYPQI
jgi:hypothetical protein